VNQHDLRPLEEGLILTSRQAIEHLGSCLDKMDIPPEKEKELRCKLVDIKEHYKKVEADFYGESESS
jgi:hypothetical protein